MLPHVVMISVRSQLSFFDILAPYSITSTSEAQKTIVVNWTKPGFIYAALNGSDTLEATMYSNSSVTFNVSCTSNGNPTVSSMHLNSSSKFHIANHVFF